MVLMTRATHLSPTEASTSTGVSDRLKPSSSESSVEKCRVVPLTASVLPFRRAVRLFRSSHLPLRSAGCEHDALNRVLREARHASVDPSRDRHRLQEAEAARLELVELRPRPDGRVAELRRILRLVSVRTRIRVAFESAPRGTETVSPPSLLVTVCAGETASRSPLALPAASTDAEPSRTTMRPARLARVICSDSSALLLPCHCRPASTRRWY